MKERTRERKEHSLGSLTPSLSDLSGPTGILFLFLLISNLPSCLHLHASIVRPRPSFPHHITFCLCPRTLISPLSTMPPRIRPAESRRDILPFALKERAMRRLRYARWPPFLRGLNRLCMSERRRKTTLSYVFK